ncbi:MAG: hypothetical protein QOG91_655 [Candidatus Parcubacteria bacterium]|jgi:cell division septal protein FtsQ|nr:hypothetical protein [Candidatus Parcubacteria bacterium]
MRPHSRLTSHQSRKFVDFRRRRLLVTVLASVLAVAVLLFGLSRLSALPSLSISSIRLSGIDSDIAPAVEAAAEGALTGNYLGLFARSNTLIYPNLTIRRAVKAVSPRIDSVSLQRDGSQGLIIAVTEHAPSAVICDTLPDFSAGTLPDVSDNKGCYFADESGRILKPAPSFSGQVYKRYYVPSLAESSSSAAAAMSRGDAPVPEFRALQEFYDAVGASGIMAEGILVEDGGEYELFARNLSSGSAGGSAVGASATSSDSDMSADVAVIYFNNSRSFSDQLDNLVSFWKKMTTTAGKTRGPVTFEYIDVRYGSNVFYRRMQ